MPVHALNPAAVNPPPPTTAASPVPADAATPPLDGYQLVPAPRSTRLSFNQRDNIALAKQLATVSGMEAMRSIARLKITHAPAVLQIILLAVEQNVMSLEYIDKVGPLTQAARIKIAHVAAKRNGFRFSQFVRRLQITDQDLRFELAKVVVADSFAQRLNIFGHLSNYELSRKQEAIILDRAVEQNVDVLGHLEPFKPSPGQLLPVLMKLAMRDPYRLFSEISSSFKKGLWIDHALGWLPHQTHAVVKSLLLHTPHFDLLPDLAKFLSHSYDITIDLQAPQDIDALVKWLKQTMPWEKTKTASAISADMRRLDVGFALLAELITGGPMGNIRIHIDPTADPRTNSRRLLGRVVDMDLRAMEGRSYSERALADFYSYMVNLHRGLLFEPLSHSFSWDDALLQDPNLAHINRFLRTLNRLKGMFAVESRDAEFLTSVLDANIVDAHAWYHWLVKLGVTKLTVKTIEKVQARIDAAFLPRFNRFFALETGAVSIAQIQQLEAHWGNLDVLWTLVSRFASDPSWRDEIPLLGRVAQAVLTGTFTQLKYQGWAGDADDVTMATVQLAPLKTEAARQGWMQNYFLIGVFRSNGVAAQSTAKDLLAASRQKLDQLMGHLIENRGAALVFERVDEIKDALVKKPTSATVLKFKHEPASLAIALVGWTYDATTVKDYEGRLRLLKETKATLRFTPQLNNDLKSVDAALRPAAAGPEALVFTTTTDDPHLLLQIGDLVDTSSCQSARTGSHAETLLGYVVDANIKAVLSYALQPKQFATPADYARAKALVESGQAQIKFNAPQQILTIGDITLNLPQAYLRRMLKLGATTKGDAAVVLEPEYRQSHFAEALMRQQLTAVVQTLAQHSHATTTATEITTAATRNVGGVYSDLGKGIYDAAYTITPPRPEWDTLGTALRQAGGHIDTAALLLYTSVDEVMRQLERANHGGKLLEFQGLQEQVAHRDTRDLLRATVKIHR